MVANNNLLSSQFHPELRGDKNLKFIDIFLSGVNIFIT